MCQAETPAETVTINQQSVMATNGRSARNGSGLGDSHSNGHSNSKSGSMAESLTAGNLYHMALEAKPVLGDWFSIADTATRLGLAILAFYRHLLMQPLALLRFAHSWNLQWYGWKGVLLTLYLPILPFALMAAELIKRAGEYLPGAEPDWKMKGPGRVFFQRPDSFVASILWDFYLAVSVFSGSFLQYGDDKMALVHTLYDEICVKEYWYTLLDAAQARRPRQLATWDGRAAHDVGCGVASGGCNLVAKISDSYLGIGDKILKRGKAAGGDFDDLDDVQRLLEADPQYAGKQAVLCEFVSPSKAVTVSSEGFSNVHSLDIVTTRTKSGVKVLTVLLWTDCSDWSSHSCEAGYLIDVHSETIVAPTAWYSPYFAKQNSKLLGVRLPGVREACAKAVAAHEASELPWLTTVGWDAMITDDGVYFFEGNVAAYRTPRRIFLTPSITRAFFEEFRGEGSPVPS